jgi:hypothetical protein
MASLWRTPTLFSKALAQGIAPLRKVFIKESRSDWDHKLWTGSTEHSLNHPESITLQRLTLSFARSPLSDSLDVR